MHQMSSKKWHKVFLREKLPNPRCYYAAQFPSMKLNHKLLWNSMLCCFHEEVSPSLCINLNSGGFICFGCGVKGGDIVEFHRRRYGLSFVQTVDFFNAWGEAK